MFHIPVDDEIYLGLLEERHSQPLFECVDVNREHLRQWLPWVDETTTVDDSWAFIRSALERFAAGTGITTGVFYGGKLVGVVSYNQLNHTHHEGEIGYWLGQAYQGRGIMTRACKALLAYGFEELELHRVVIRCDVENQRSRAVAERLGFTREGILRQSILRCGRYRDMVLYSKLRREWETQG